MFRTSDALLQDCHDLRHVAANEGGRIEPQAGKNLAAKNSLRVWGQRYERPFAQNEPVELFIQDTPDKILADAIPTINGQFRVQVKTHAAARYFADQFRRIFDIIIGADGRLPTPGGI